MRAPRLAPALLCLLAAAALAPGCGDSDGGESTASPPPPAESRPAPPASAFPSAEGRSLREVLKAADGPAEAVVQPAAEVFYPGWNRYPFAVFDRDEGEIPDAEVALYLAKVPAPKPGEKSKSGNRGPDAKAQLKALDQLAWGPFPASIESMATKPMVQTQALSEDQRIASAIYSVELNLPGEGEWRVAAILKEDGELRGVSLPSVVAGQFKRIPELGEKAPTLDPRNAKEYARALGKEPIVLLFATPKFCQSRVCGPVLDVAKQAEQEYGDEAAFIEMDIFNGNDPENGVRPEVRAFHLPTEPYLFTIDRQGIVRGTVEGAFGLRLMREAVEKAIAR